MSNKLVLLAFTSMFLSMVVVGGFVRLVAAGEGNGKVTVEFEDTQLYLNGFRIYFEDPDGISRWKVYQSGGGSMEATYNGGGSPPTNCSSEQLSGWVQTYIDWSVNMETEFPLRIEVEDGDSDVEWWKVYSDMSTEGAFRDPECTDLIPEFPSFLILPLFMIVTLLAVIVYQRKRSIN